MPTSNEDYGFTFNGHHSSDFGLKVMSDKTVTLPAKNKVTVQLPYANGLIDLSDIYGNNSYGERTMTVSCRLYTGRLDYMATQNMYHVIADWLMGTKGKTKLIDDADPYRFYLAEVEAAPTITEGSVYSTIAVVFQCYPFLFHPNEYNELWDTFDLINGVMQPTEYDISGSESIVLVNTGEAPINLICDAISDFRLNIDGVICPISAGMTDNMDVQLQPGENHIKITGNGTLKFDWTEEVI